MLNWDQRIKSFSQKKRNTKLKGSFNDDLLHWIEIKRILKKNWIEIKRKKTHTQIQAWQPKIK